MPPLRTYNVFISHAWSHSEEYYRLEEMLDKAPNFQWKNYSVPAHDGFGKMSQKALEDQLLEQIRPTSVVLILAGMYINNSDWIQKEIDMAAELGKPIIGIKPWGNEFVPKIVKESSNGNIVGWYTPSIIEAIRSNSLSTSSRLSDIQYSSESENNDELWDIIKAVAIVGGLVIGASVIAKYFKQKQEQYSKPRMPW